jgi:hypothetical protein
MCPLGNGRYIQPLIFLAVSLLGHLHTACGGFRNETATWIQKWFKISVRGSRRFIAPCIMAFRGGGDGRGHTLEICVKYLVGRSVF